MDSPEEVRELLAETEWMRVYRTGPSSVLHESKFAADGLQVSAESIKRRWGSLTLSEQVDFAASFVSKPELNRDDEEILLFLMETGVGPVIAMVCYSLPKLSDRQRALGFLLQAAPSQENGYAANWYQALETLGDARAVPFLRRHYEDYRKNLAPLEERTDWELLNYSACLDALWRLDESQEYRDARADLLTHPDPEVREDAQQHIFENKLQDLTRGRRPPAAGQQDLVKETEWSRVYCAANNYCWAVSKFRTDPLEVSADGIREPWAALPIEEKIEFAQAFCQRPEFTPQDLNIVDLLINEGPEYVRTSVAIYLSGRSNRETVVSFLLERASAPGASFPHYFRVLWPLAGAGIILPLRQQFEDYRNGLLPLERRGIAELSEYIRCLGALCRLGDSEDEASLRELLQHPDALVRRRAQQALPRQTS